jgi:hypothetical protein
MRHVRALLPLLLLTVVIMVIGIGAYLHAQTQVTLVGSNAVVTGTRSLTTTAVPISVTTVSVRELLLQCDAANLVDCYIGNSTTQVVHLVPGQALTIPIANLQLLYAKTASSTAIINYLGRQ